MAWLSFLRSGSGRSKRDPSPPAPMEKFVLKDVVEIPKLGLKALRLKHKSSGLVHLHVQRANDRNRVFSLAFKTNAPDKTGVPHILEHTTLCGSQKFPVRDPFFKMQTRSLANFMNAMTGSDYTYYAFATTNRADYENLQHVYMDSVFSPLLREQDFNQEGWRLEHEKFDDPSTPLILKGVVYNEMKGQFSMPAYYFYKSYFQAVYPSLEYSAGDPQFIPDLRYDDLVKFHRDQYRADNCFTFSYGNFDAEEAVTHLSEYLDSGRATPNTEAEVSKEVLQPLPLPKNVEVAMPGPVDPMFDENKQHKVSLTWYVGEPTDVIHTLAWRVLGLLLADGHASPFHRTLIDAGLAPEFSVNTGLDETPAQLMFTVGLQGLAKEDIPKFKAAVFATLDELVDEGFEDSRIAAIIHQAELADREVDANFGMGLLNRVVQRAFVQKDDMMETLDSDKLISAFKDKIAADPKFFQAELAKMRKSTYFEFQMYPDPQFEEQLTAKEKEVLEAKLSTLSPSKKQSLLAEGVKLAEAQQREEDLSSLPTVNATDIAVTAPFYPVSELTMGSKNAPLLVRETPTQGVSYVRLLKNMSGLRPDLIPYLSTYADALTSLGTQKNTMAEMEELIKLYTGGIGASAVSNSRRGRPLDIVLGYSMSSLDEKLPDAYRLLEELMTQPRLDDLQKLKLMIDADASNIVNALSSSGHRYAVNRATAAISQRRALDDKLGGFSHVQLLKQLSALDQDALGAELSPKLREIHQAPWYIRAGLTFSPSMLPEHEKLVEPLTQRLNAMPFDQGGTLPDLALAPRRTVVPLGFRVSYAGVALKGPSIENADSAALAILANLLTHRYLHPEIREKGGAYGGGGSYNSLEGLFTMYSYRDPTPHNTLEVMSKAGKWASERKWTDRDIEEGKIGIFQGIDSPISPRSEISQQLWLGLTQEEVQKRRENLLAVTPADLNRVAIQYLGGLTDLQDAGVCVIGGGDSFVEGFKGYSEVKV